MRRLLLALLVAVAVALLWPLSHRAASLSNGARTFRVATFNIHKGADRGNHYDLQRTIEAIAHLDADVVGVQEAMQNHPDFNCDDQPSLIAAGLRKGTGSPWKAGFGKGGLTDHPTTQGRGRREKIPRRGLA